MRALRLLAVGRAELLELEPPAVAGDDVLVRVERAGICGTDLEILRGEFPSRPPVTMGHEYAGVVEAAGPGAGAFRPGDRVTSAGAWSCGACAACLRGEPGLCAERRMLGSNADGAFAELVRVPARIVRPLPDGVDADAAQSMVAVAVCLRALRRVPPDAGRTAVSGPGHLGLILLQLLEGDVTLFGTRDERLAIGRGLGAETVNVRSEDWREHAGAFGVVFETAGTPASFLQALELAAPGGTVCVLGTSTTPVDGFATSVLYDKELTLVGSKGGAGEYDEALRVLAAGEVSLAPLISHRFTLDDGADALGAAADRDRLPIRVVIEAG
jgi:L-iditol 2-dehydrogenase